MNTIKKALEKCRTYVAVQKFGCGMTGIGHGVEDNILQFLNEADEELARLEKREPTLMSDCISAGLPLDVALKYDVQLCRLTNYVRDKTLADCVKQEPVGYQYLFKSPFGGEVWRDSDAMWNGNKPKASREIYAAPVDAKAIRAEALEEAAEWCDRLANNGSLDAEDCAAAIRSLK